MEDSRTKYEELMLHKTWDDETQAYKQLSDINPEGYNPTGSDFKHNEAIDYCEEVYPETTQEFKRIQEEMYETFCKKQRNYGPGNISVGTPLESKEDIKLSLTGLWFRMNDKIQRLLQLVVKGEPDEVGESIQDTYEDLSVYGIIAQIVQRGKWGE